MKNLLPRTILTSLLACFALTSTALAVDPPPDGGYADGNTAEGEDALFSLTRGGVSNTAIGFQALCSLTIGFDNTAFEISRDLSFYQQKQRELPK